MNTVKVREEYGFESRTNAYYQSNPQININDDNQVIEGFFPKENSEKEMAIRKLNLTLCMILGLVILITSVSYYFATANEMTLNDLSRQTTVLNDENAELQNRLDKLKSFNNVDMTMQKSNMLTKAKQVIEVPQKNSATVANNKFDSQKPFSWAVGY